MYATLLKFLALHTAIRQSISLGLSCANTDVVRLKECNPPKQNLAEAQAQRYIFTEVESIRGRFYIFSFCYLKIMK